MKSQLTSPHGTKTPQPAILAAAHKQAEQILSARTMQPYLNTMTHSQEDNGHTQAPCHILDAKYEPGKKCSVLYQVGEEIVVGDLKWNGTILETAESAELALPPNMQIYPYERDPALPGLTTVLDDAKMVEILNAVLPEYVEGQKRVLRCRATPLRYRLGRRCTVRFDLRLRDDETGEITRRTLYGKLYHCVSKAQAVYEEMQTLAAAPTLQGDKLVVAQAVAFLPHLPMILQAPIEGGMPLELLLDRPTPPTGADKMRLEQGIQRAAAAMAALHQVNMRTHRVRAVDVELKRIQKRSDRFMVVEPETGRYLSEMASNLHKWLERLPSWGAEITVVHGDCKPSQFFLMSDPQGDMGTGPTALLDFDHCGMADPASDVGNFMATLRQMAMKLTVKEGNSETVAAMQTWLATLEEIFLTEYMATRPCHPGFRWRAIWYQAMALQRKAIRSFARSIRSPLPKLMVEEAWRCLETLPID